MIFFLPKQDGDSILTPLQLQGVLFKAVLAEWKRNVAPPIWSEKKQKWIPDTFHPDFRPLCTYVRKVIRGQVRTNYDLTYVDPRLSKGGENAVAFYVTKYMMKHSDRADKLQKALRLNLSDDDYKDAWSVLRPRHFESEQFGLASKGKRKAWIPSEKIVSHLKRGISLSKADEFAKFFTVDGKSFPLSRYYKSKGFIYSVGDAMDFYFNSKKSRPDNVVISDDCDPSQVYTDDIRFFRSVDNVELKQNNFDLDDLYL